MVKLLSKISDAEAVWERSDPERWVSRTGKGISQKIVEEISSLKGEPDWMREKRLAAYRFFESKQMPTWGVDLSGLNFDDITFFIRPDERRFKTWDEVPGDIRRVYDGLGIPQAEQKFLAGLVGQYESESFYGKIREKWEKQGVIFTDTDTAVQKYPDLVKEYFMTRCVPIADHKFAALHGAVWSGGSFVYIPKGVHVDLPLQAYFRMNASQSGQFEHTLIIAEEGSSVHYIESCTAPKYTKDSLHSAVVEIFVKKGASVRYTTIQNWSKNVYNLNTKRAIVEEDGTMEWVGGSLGCLTGDTLVYTAPEGPVPMRDIKPGTQIYSLDLNIMQMVKARVRAFQKSGIKDIFEIKTENGRVIRGSANHPFLVYDRVRKTLGWRSVEDIYERHSNNSPQHLAIANLLPDEGSPYLFPRIQEHKGAKNKVVIPAYSSEEVMWLLGIYLGDGFIEKSSKERGSFGKVDRRVYFAIPPTARIRQKTEHLLKKIFGCMITYKAISITVSSRMLCEWIRGLGFSGLASTKRVPRWIFSLPHAEKLAFIEGYLDSDGHVRKKFSMRKRVPTGATFTSCNPVLLEDMRMLMVTCGLNPGNLLSHTRKRPPPAAKGNRTYTNYAFNVPGSEVAIIRCHRPREASQVVFSRVISIRRVGEEMTYDIEVDGPPNFIANGIIAHNSKATMLYPMSVLTGSGAHARHLNIALAGPGQWKDTGAKVIHGAPHTSSRVISKSISLGGGRSSYRGLLKIAKGARGSKAHVQCDALLLDEHSQSDTYPYMEIYEDDVSLMHEATVNRVTDDQLFYLRSRGLTEEQALDLILAGFLDPISRELPLDYAIELNRFIRMEMTGSVG